MAIIDFHSHILPKIDDGSKSIDTSLDMLRESTNQGVDVMIATPHFYAQNERIETFIEKRKTSYDNLMSALKEKAPTILLGAEVTLFNGISDADDIDSLLIQNTDILLLEMPFRPWNSHDMEEIRKMVREGDFRIMFAHLERFMKISQNKHYINELLEMPVLVQINSNSLLDWKQSRKLVRLFRDGKAHVLGSDCHGMRHRPPNLLEGRAVLSKKNGEDFIKRMDEFGTQLLSLDRL